MLQQARVDAPCALVGGPLFASELLGSLPAVGGNTLGERLEGPLVLRARFQGLGIGGTVTCPAGNHLLPAVAERGCSPCDSQRDEAPACLVLRRGRAPWEANINVSAGDRCSLPNLIQCETPLQNHFFPEETCFSRNKIAQKTRNRM